MSLLNSITGITPMKQARTTVSPVAPAASTAPPQPSASQAGEPQPSGTAPEPVNALRKPGVRFNLDAEGCMIDSQGITLGTFSVVQDADGTFRLSLTFKFD